MTPGDEWVVDKGFKHGHQRLAVIPQDLQHVLTGKPEAAFHPPSFHAIDKHPRETERHGFRELGPGHRNFEAVPKVDVDNTARNAIQHQVRGMPIAQTEDITSHRHDSERACVVVAALEPDLRVARFEPEHLGYLHSTGLQHH